MQLQHEETGRTMSWPDSEPIPRRWHNIGANGAAITDNLRLMAVRQIIESLEAQSRIVHSASIDDETAAAINEADRIADLLRGALNEPATDWTRARAIMATLIKAGWTVQTSSTCASDVKSGVYSETGEWHNVWVYKGNTSEAAVADRLDVALSAAAQKTWVAEALEAGKNGA